MIINMDIFLRFCLFKCVFSYYEYLWLRNKGVDASSLFEGLPLCLQADITLSLYKDLIERVKGSLSLCAFSMKFSIFFFFWGGGGHIICDKASLRITDIVICSCG